MATTLTAPTAPSEPANPENPELVLRSADAAWDRARWERLPADGNRYEVIDGVLYMTTAPSTFHQWILRQVFLGLFQQIDQTGWGLTLWSPIGVFMPGCDPVQPDLLVIRGADRHVFQEGDIRGVPALIVEVQSPSNPALDNRVKRVAYARAGVPEYWIVHPAARDVVVCSQPDTAVGDYAVSQMFAEGDELVSSTLPVRLQVADLFAGAPDTSL